MPSLLALAFAKKPWSVPVYASQQTVEYYNTIAEANAAHFRPGERRKGLFAPQWHYPLLDENPPDLEPERDFTLWAALGFAVAGVILLVFAWKKGRLFA